MRWKSEEAKLQELIDGFRKGTVKYRTKFLWWPKSVGLETRWLERVTIKSKCGRTSYKFPGQWVYGWHDVEFVDKENG
jgi:hypothetical protein